MIVESSALHDGRSSNVKKQMMCLGKLLVVGKVCVRGPRGRGQATSLVKVVATRRELTLVWGHT